MEDYDLTLGPCIDEIVGKSEYRFNENKKPMSGPDSYLEQIKINVPRSPNPTKEYQVQRQDITNMVIDLS